MSKPISICFVAPPFGGHLFPLLQLARGLRLIGYDQISIASTPEAETAARHCGFELTRLFENNSHRIMEIANTRVRIGSNPVRLLQQFRANLSLMEQLQSELTSAWQSNRPDLVIADLTVPVAGLLAESMGIAWWTSLPTICVLETGDGTPSYLGGWSPPKSVLGEVRDRAGRRATRIFKQTLFRMFRRQLNKLGLDRVYRKDGLERIYSHQQILGLGVKEFEFPRSWPKTLSFIGPLTGSPPMPHEPPIFVPGRSHVLVSLGTHLGWAKTDARDLIQKTAELMPDVVFHFTDGNFNQACSPQPVIVEDNFHRYRYLPYDSYLHHYDASINHSGTGVMYACLSHGVPVLAWPQDYDQFDHTARMVHHGVGKKLTPDPEQIANDLRFLMEDSATAASLQTMKQTIATYDPITQCDRLLREGM